jgi:hypothetical protein
MLCSLTHLNKVSPTEHAPECQQNILSLKELNSTATFIFIQYRPMFYACNISSVKFLFTLYGTTNKLRRRVYMCITAVSVSYIWVFYVKYFFHKYLSCVWVQNVNLV